MCGRYTRTSNRDVIASEFGVVQFVNVDLSPRYNIAPSQNIEAIIRDGEDKRLGPMRWGFTISATAPTPVVSGGVNPRNSGGDTRSSPDSGVFQKPFTPINARAETVATSPMFRDAFRRHRCLVVADGFYEWRKDGQRKIPYFIHLRSGRPFGFAGIWSMYRTDMGQRIGTCAIVTCPPNDLMAPIHNRMPVILSAVAGDRWLDPNTAEVDLHALLVPLSSEDLEAYEVSTLVNSPKNDSVECVARIGHIE